jgi:signal transduction histidine kinase
VAFANTDPARLRQIVRNLVANARRHGGPRVRIAVAADRDRVLVSIMDNGDGVPPDALDRIFLAYESAHPRTGQPGTLGVGLPMSREPARLMGGDLRYRHIGKRAIFEVVLQPAKTPAIATGHRHGHNRAAA